MHHSLLGLSVLLVAGCGQPTPSSITERPRAAEAGGPPPTAVAPVPLCGPDEPGEKLAFGGRVLDYQGRPLPKAAVVAYNADRAGLYVPPDSGTRVPRLRGAAVTDDLGQFRFATVRPGPYPGGDEPAHIHLVVTAPAHRPRFVTYWFEGDPLITPAKREKAARDPEMVIVPLARDPAGAWVFAHDIRLEAD